MIIRISTPTRQLRFHAEPFENLHDLIISKLNIKLYTAKFEDNVIDAKNTLENLKIGHGSEIYLEDITENEVQSKKDSVERTESVSSKKDSKSVDGISKKDAKLADGISNNASYKNKSGARSSGKYEAYKPEQPNDSILCNHDKSAMCVNCAPKNPWDPTLHKHAKYLSFEAYKEMHEKEKVIMDPISYKKKECDRHEVNATCTVCNPRSIILESQIYRMIDHIEFDNKEVLNSFCSFYRQTKRQRIGFLIGKIEDYERVPMGRKVKVSWVYECVQESFPDGFIVEDDVMKELFSAQAVVQGVVQGVVQDVVQDGMQDGMKDGMKDGIQDGMKVVRRDEKIRAKESGKANGNADSKLSNKPLHTLSDTSSHDFNTESESFKDIKKYKIGLKSIKALKDLLKHFEMQIVGVIFTDLGRKRDFICSGLEIEFMAELQNKNKHFCESIKNYFNSKFVTVIVTNTDPEEFGNGKGDSQSVEHSKDSVGKESDFCLNEFMVSEQAMELCQNDLIAATENPNKMKKTTRDIFYKDLNEYKINVQIKADPFLQVEYFLVKLTHGFKSNPFFNSEKYFDWRFGLKKIANYFENNYYENTLYGNLNLLIRLKMEVENLEKVRIRKEKEELEKRRSKKKSRRPDGIRDFGYRRVEEVHHDDRVEEIIEEVNNSNARREVNNSNARRDAINLNNSIVRDANNMYNERHNKTDKQKNDNEEYVKSFDYNTDFKKLLKYIKSRNINDFNDFIASEYFLDLKESLSIYEEDEWACNACTFLNVNVTSCKMCGSNK